MKKIYDILSRACVYTVLMTILICTVGLLSNGSPYLPVGQFLILTLIGIVLSLAQLIFRVQAISMPLRILIHYFTLLSSLLFLFSLTGKTTGTPAGYFVSGVLISIVYGLILLAVVAIKKVGSYSDKSSPSQIRENREKSTYTPRFK